MKLFSSNTFRQLEQSLTYSSLKQKVISNNIANVDTPNYKAKKVSFKTELNNAALKANRTSNKHFEFSSAPQKNISVQNRTNTSYNHNGNSVDIDLEMSEMAKNQIFYNVVTDRINGKFSSMKEVLKGGK